VVEPGECLWTIAERQLGGGASDASVAAVVDELWRLNAERIGTGDPNLIHAGQTLKLP
jgi:Tfp pilus assembly protein FimV